MVLAMACDDFSCMILAMLLVVGLFDMSLWGFVDWVCAKIIPFPISSNKIIPFPERV